MSVLFLILGALAPPAPAADSLARFEYSQIHMGMRTRLVVYAAARPAAEDGCRAAFRRIGQLDAMMSDYRIDSELNRLSASAGSGRAVPVSPELFTVLSFARVVSEHSHGLFDVTVGPLVALWRRARQTGVAPGDAERAAALAAVGYEKLVLDPAARTALLTTPGMKLDLGAIAKGYIGDQAIAALRAAGLPAALFEAGGDISLGDPPPGRFGWTIDFGGGRLIELHNCGVSASGDTVQFVVIGGRRYSHVIDPHTGWGLSTRCAASVMAPDALTSDALSTAATLLGPEAGTRLLSEFPGAWGWVTILDDDEPLWPPRLHPRDVHTRGL